MPLDETPPVEGRTTAVAPPGSPELRSLLSLAVAAVVVATLYVAQDVLLPIILAVMLSFVLSPVVTTLGRAGLSRVPSVALTILMTFSLVGLAGTLLAHQAAALAADAPRYANAIQEKLQGLELFATSRIGVITRLIGRDESTEAPTVQAPPPSIARRPSDAAPLTAAAAANRGPVLVRVAGNTTSPFVALRAVVEPVLGPLETTVIVLVITIFVLMEREDLRDRFIRLAGSNDLHRTTAAMDDAGRRLSRYFLSQVAVNGTFGLVIGIGLWAIGIPSPALWGVLAGLLRFVPYIGPILGSALPLALAAASEPGWWRVIEVALLFVIVEPITGYVVEPLLYGHSTGLAPVSVIVAAVFWTWIWGPIGLILSTPLTLCLVVMGRHVKSLEFFDVLLGDRPALAPVENLYQRILADSPDEVLEKAETLLEERTLLEYYDGVVLPALKLAAEDQARGLITRQRAGEMTSSLMQVIDDLADHEDRVPKQETAGAEKESPKPANTQARSGRMVACVSGRGPFDDAVSAMLAQLLARSGVPSRTVAHTHVTREGIARFDLDGASVVALSYLDMSGSLSHLRYLIRRVRQHAPGVAVVVGLWPAAGSTPDEPPGADEARRQAVGADFYVSSLAEAVAVAPRAVTPSAAPREGRSGADAA